MTRSETGVPRLVVTGPAERTGMVLPLPGPEQVIGHSDTADIVLDDKFVSRRHALVTTDPSGTVTIRDLNSTSGTFVNGERLAGARVLRPGDVVQFADLTTRFEPASTEGAASTAMPPDATTVVTPAGAGTSAAGGAGSGDGASSAAGAGGDGPGAPSSIVIAEAYYTVTGTVTSPALPGVGGLTVQLVDKNVGGDQVITSTQTSGDGSYAFTQVPISDLYLGEHYKTAPDLQAQVYAGGTFLAASAVAYSAPATVTLDVVLPAGTPGLPSEYETLAASLAAVYPGNLADLQEGGGLSDLTYLGNKIELDVRAVALAALSNQLSQMTAPIPAPPGEPGQTQVWPTATASLAPEFYYALMRAGLPATPDGLFRVSPATATTIWQQAIASNVIPQQLVKELPSAAASFQTLSAAQLLTAPPQAGLSTLQDMLAPTLPSPDQQQQFASIYAQYQGNWAGFWPAVEQALGTEVAGQLQLTGQLNYIMGNNQQVVAALTQAEVGNPITTAADLASRGYYDAAAWTPLIGSSVPPGIPGADPGEQAASYAQVLAAQVRLAYPTAVLADQVRRSVMPIADTAEVAAGVADFLAANQGSFEIGVEPVQAFIARTGLTGTPDAVVGQVQRLQRAYQLTPDDASMAVLLGHNLDSAFAVTRYDPAGFVRALGDQLGGADQAAAIHQRARQVFASVLSVAVGYLGARSAPTLGGGAPVQYGLPPQPAAGAEPAAAYSVPAYPTLEELFGSLDFCNCSDCGSVLSPAAYLVDLLNYLDQPAPAAGFGNPQDTLLARRPDLQYLPLTCANTNTALPYIDIVNETLEYFVANGRSLAGYTGHDTGDTVTSAELIASPQYVNDAAYTILEGAFFPAPLPFSRPLELLRLHLASLGVTLADAMTALRASDDLTDTRTPASYGWRDILTERLGISRPEYRLFTDPALQLGDLYGLPNPTALATLQTTSLQDFSRRLGVSYDDLTAIVSTQFINPNARLIPRLQRLGAPFSTLQALHDNLGTPQSIAAEFIAALPAGLDATEYGGASPTDYQAAVAWVTGPQVYPLIMDIITISNPSGSASDCSGADLQLRYANPDATANLLTGTDFVKLIRFIRLWRKLQPLLGNPDNAVTIAQTDEILAALYPAADLPAGSGDVANDPANRALLDAGFAALLPRAGFTFQVLSLLSLTADQALGQLLACWAPIGTAGPASLYQTMFLTPTLLQQDPGAQTATVAGTVNAGDVLTTTINGVGVSYTVAPGDTAASAAAASAAAINAQTTPDPASGLPLNGRFVAASAGNVITITAGVTLACALSAAASETYTAAGTPVSWSATVGGTVTAGDTLITTIDTVPVPYPVVSGDTPATIAAGIAAAVNAATTADPYSGLPLNGLVVASSAGPVVTVAAANAGAPFALACSLQSAGGGTYTAAPTEAAAVTANITGPVQPGDTLVTTVNAVAVPYTAGPGDTGPAQLAASIAVAIGAAVQPDPATGLALGTEIRAASASGMITVTAVDAATPLVLTCAVTTGAEQYIAAGPVPETATATVAGTIPAGATLTTTINALPVPYLAATGDTPATIAAAIAAAVNAVTATDPVTGLPLNAVVTASAAAGVITFTGLVPTTAFTLAAALSAGGYTAGRRNPSFADDGYGDFLTDPAQTLLGHEPTLCAACHLTGAEFALITAALGFDASTPLTLDNVSALLRNGWLAHALGLSVREFLLLRTCTGLDPFAPPDPAPASPAQPPVITFIALLGALAAAGLGAATALYLIWNADIAGNSAPTTADVTGLARTLVADFAAVQAAFTLQDDPDGSIAEGLMTLVYGAAATDFFFGLLNGTLTALATQQAVGPFFASYPELQLLYDAYAASSDPVQARRQALLDAFLPILTAKRKQEQALAAVTSAAGTDPSFATALLQDPAILQADADTSQPAAADLTAIESQGLTAQFFLGNDPSAAPDIEVDAAPVLSYGTGNDDGGGSLPPGSGGSIAGIWSGYLTAPQDGTYAINVATDPGAAVTLELGGVAVAMKQAGGVWSSQDPVALTAGQLVTVTLTATSITTTLSVSWQSLGLGWEVIPTGYLYPLAPVTRLGHTYLRFLKAAALASALSLTAAEIGYLATAPGFPVTGQSWLNVLAADGAPDPAVAAALAGVLTGLLDVARIKQALSPADERLLAVLRNPLAILQNGQSALLSLTGWSLASVNSLLTQFFGSTDLAALSSVANLARVYDAYAVVTTCGLTASAVIAGITNAPSADTVSALQSALRAQYAEPDWLTVVGPINDRARVQQRDALVGYILQQLGDGDAPSPLPVQTADDLYASLLIDTQTQPPVLTSRIRLALSAVQLFIERVLRNLEPGVWPGDVNASQWTWMKRYRVWQANREVFLWPENWLFPELRDDPSPFFQQMMSSLLQGDITDDAAASAYLSYLTSLEEVAKLEPCGLYYQPGSADADETSYVVARTAGAHRTYYFRELSEGAWTPWAPVEVDCEDLPITPIVWNGRLFLFWLKVIKQAAPQHPSTNGMPAGAVTGYDVTGVQQYAQAAGQAQNTVAVYATLCWTEYYNGTWQPTKTSDVNRPTLIGPYDAAGPGTFENYRSQVRIVPAQFTGASPLAQAYEVGPAQFTLPDDGLMLAITVAGSASSGGFILHNTHSLPIIFDDVKLNGTGRLTHGRPPDPVTYPMLWRVPLAQVLDPPSPSRTGPSALPYTGGYGGGTFELTYQAAPGSPPSATSDILTYTWQPRWVDAQPGLADAWDAPFLYEDRRHLFYVTTTEQLVLVRDFQGFGVPPEQALALPQQAPPLVLRQPAIPPLPGELLAANAGTGDPATVQRFLVQSTNLRAALPGQLTVTYQGQVMSPTGSLPAAAPPAAAPPAPTTPATEGS